MKPSPAMMHLIVSFLTIHVAWASFIPRGISLPSPKAVYFMTNDRTNAIVALRVNTNGTLSDGSITETGGSGESATKFNTGMPAGPDALFSQGAVAVAKNSLIAVNPGSNTISLFRIDENDPTKLSLLGEPVDTLGDFPTTVDISTKLSQVCVANTGIRAGVSCFSFGEDGLKPLDQARRPFYLNQTTPPVGNPNTVSQIFFNEDSSALITLVKGDPRVVGNHGFVSYFPSIDGQVSRHEVLSSPNGTTTLFGSAIIPGTSRMLTTDPNFGAAMIEIEKSGEAKTVLRTVIPGQIASCWASYSSKTGTVFVTDGAVNNLVEIDPHDGELLSNLKPNNTNTALIDLVTAEDFVYALFPGTDTEPAAVTIFDVSGGRGAVREIQNFYPKGISKRKSLQGLAVYV